MASQALDAPESNPFERSPEIGVAGLPWAASLALWARDPSGQSVGEGQAVGQGSQWFSAKDLP